MSESTTPSKTPSHYVYTVRDRKDQEGVWTRIGAAWPAKNGKGFNILLDALPVNGRLALQIPSEKKD